MKKHLWIVAYIALVVLANFMTATLGLVPIGFGLAVTAGTFAAGAVLIARDAVQLSSPRWVVFACITAGAVLTALTSTYALAFASFLAFVVSEIVDWAVFSRLYRRSLTQAVVVSSVMSSPIDTVLFLWIAGFGVTWQAVLGQFIVKTGMALIVAIFLPRKIRDLSERS